MRVYQILLFTLFTFFLIVLSYIYYSSTLLSDSINNRNCYDFTYAHLNLEFFLEEKKIKGCSELHFEKKCDFDTLIVDLFNHFSLDSILICNQKIDCVISDNKIFIPNKNCLEDSFVIKVFYHGIPIVSNNPPWEGGFIWAKDSKNLDWVSVACQKDGASLWWPNKDELSDEPDSMKMSFITKEPYFIVSNGLLDTIVDLGDQKRLFSWIVSNPINNYNVTFNLGNYTYFNDTLLTPSGILNLDYYVLPKNLLIAKTHFHQVKPMLSFFEKKFGPYPFYKDGYKLVETPYVGMEHQSCISYGNKYKKGYLGRFPGDMDFDFIIIHETAHEWWGNSVSMQNRRDMWIHEAFATYAEALYVENLYGYDNMLIYLESQKKYILNKNPIINNNHTNTDMYYKGSWMLHTLRTVLNNDSIWDNILKGLQLKFRHNTVNTDDIVNYIESHFGYDLHVFFQQYLYTSSLPVFQYYFTKKNKQYFLHFKWDAVSDQFHMPILATINNNNAYSWIYPNNNWKKIEIININPDNFSVADNLLLFELEKIK